MRRPKRCRGLQTDNAGGLVVAAGPLVWNNLPSYLRQDVSYGQFKRQLNISVLHLFVSKLTTTHCDCLFAL